MRFFLGTLPESKTQKPLAETLSRGNITNDYRNPNHQETK